MPATDAPNVEVAAPNPPVAPPTPTPSEDGIDPRAKGLMARLFDHIDEEEKAPVEEDKKPKQDPVKEPVVAKEKKVDPVAAEPEAQIKVRRPKVKRPELPVDRPVPAIAPAAQTQASAQPVDNKWRDSLGEGEKEMLADAGELEELLPGKYKGFVERTEKFLRENAAKRAQEDFDENAQEYRAWLEKNQPRLSTKEAREVQETRVANRLKGEFEAKHNDLKHQLYARDQEPKIEHEGRALFTELANTSLPEEVASEVKRLGYDKASETYRMELETAQEILSGATEDIKEFLRVTRIDPETKRPLMKEATDPSDPKFAQHERLRTLLKEICESFKETAPQAQQVKDGKWFVTRDEWAKIRPDARHQFWTFNNKQIIDRAKLGVKDVIAATIAQKRQYLEQRGYVRKVSAPAPAQTQAPVSTTPPAPRSAPIPGSSVNGVTNDGDARAARVLAAINRET